ncbi:MULTISPECIES: hypothetical protein [unclassified Microcoleus]|uniref:hypothetical protein n=1 Tax=unclassified Microcoleus TaxID=2642155 RepID=UPI002FD4D245
MAKDSRASVQNDPKIEAVLDRLHHPADRQFGQLLLHYLPKLPRLFTGKGIRWETTGLDFYNDKYISIERDRGNFLYLLGRSIDAKTIVEYGTSFGISTLYLATAVRDKGVALLTAPRLCLRK